MRRGFVIASLTVVISLLATLAFSEALGMRVERLRRATQYDLALGHLEDAERRGDALSPTLRWALARLTPDADRFDRLAASLAGGRSAEDSLAQAIVYARAREQFARGQYLSSLENLRSLPPSASQRFSELPLFRAMAAQATGEIRSAREELARIERRDPQYGMAQLLLADLQLRSRDGDGALAHAEAVLRSDREELEPQAMHAKSQALRVLGRVEDAEEVQRDLRRRHPHSVEASWAAESTPAASKSIDPDPKLVSENETPPQRTDFSLQLGAFHDRSLALRHAQRMIGKIEQLRVERDLEATPPLYRVIGESFSTRTRAEERQVALRGEGIDSVILAPGRGER